MKRTVIQVGWDERDTLSQGARERHVTAKQHTHTQKKTNKKKQTKKNKEMTHYFSLISLEFSLRILNDTRHTGTLNRAGLGFEYFVVVAQQKKKKNFEIRHNIRQ